MEYNYTLDYVRITPERQIGMHTGDCWELSLVVKGAGTRILGDTEESFTHGDLVLVPPGIPHQWKFDSKVVSKRGEVENITLFFGDSLVERLISAFPKLMRLLTKLKENRDAIVYQGQIKKQITGLLKEMVRQDEVYQALSVLHVLTLLANVDAKEYRPISYQHKQDILKERLSKVRIYVSCNFMNRITIDEISTYVGMSRSAFCVFFKQQTGETFIAYLNRVRMEQACMFLEKGTYSISEVCWNNGFKDLASFSRAFKKRYGVSPSDYSKGERHKNQLEES